MTSGLAKKLKRDRTENKRLAKVAYQLSDLKKLRQLLNENRDQYHFLIQFKEMPIWILEKELKVPRILSEAFLIYDPPLTPDVIEIFRQTSSRRFWE